MEQYNTLYQLVPQRVSKILNTLQTQVWDFDAEQLEVKIGPVTQDPVDLKKAKKQKLSQIKAGDRFGKPDGDWAHVWFTLKIPAPKKGEKGRRYLHWDVQGEATVYVDGKPWAGLDVGHRECILPDKAATLWIEVGTWQTGVWVPGATKITPFGLEFNSVVIKRKEELVWDTYWDLNVLIEVVKELYKKEGLQYNANMGYNNPLEKVSPLLRTYLALLSEAADVYVSGDLKAFNAALKAVYKKLPAESWQPIAKLCGHAHIDLVWLWPEKSTEKKGIHSFATLMRTFERYPEAVFVQSQPALYRAIERE